MEDLLDTGAESGRKEMVVNANVAANLAVAGTWAKVLSIIQIVFLGLGMLGGLFALFANPLLGIVFLALYGFMLYIALVLLKFGSSANTAAASTSQAEFEIAMEKLALFFKLAGITTIVIIALYIVFFAVLGSTNGFVMLNKF